jgi:hypothetical protein
MKDWYHLSQKVIIGCRVLIIIAILLIFIRLTNDNTTSPYNIYIIVGEVALAIGSIFTIIRMNSFRPRKKYNAEDLKDQSQLVLLLEKITYDIERFDESASFYFNGVRVYKYSTMILAGVSTILLGLNVNLKPNFLPKDFVALYPDIAKNVAFIIGAIITVYSGLMTYWNIEKYWLQNKSVANKLRTLKDKIENEDKAGKLTPEEIQARFDDYQDVKNDFYKYWEGALSAQSAQNK